MERLSAAEARRIAVARQGFAARNRVATPDDVHACIDQLGCVQIDSVMTVARAHRLTLASRVGRIPAGTLNGLRREGRIAEVWAHEACFIPADELPWFRAAMVAATEHRWWGPVLQEHPKLAREVMARAQDAPITAADFGGAGTPGWWEWSSAKQVIESLFAIGQLAVRERKGFTRVYDLPERLYTPAQLEPITDADAILRHRIVRTVRARGIVTRRGIVDYYRLTGQSRDVALAVDDLIAAGELAGVQVGEHAAVVEPATLGQLPARPTAAVLLCPFDNLIWDRDETDRLFSFRHALEIYVPQAKRKWGYYVLPLLHGDRIIGRADVKTDRKAGELRILAMHWEGRSAWGALDRAAGRLAWTLGCTSVTRA
ncbi:MAG: crosslink repair DNA glycosylase YcaQ family protein [Thermoleophilia bacterium]